MPNQPKKPAPKGVIPADLTTGSESKPIPTGAPLHKGPPRNLRQESLKRNVKPMMNPNKSGGR